MFGRQREVLGSFEQGSDWRVCTAGVCFHSVIEEQMNPWDASAPAKTEHLEMLTSPRPDVLCGLVRFPLGTRPTSTELCPE